MDTIIISGLRLEAFIGIYEHEKIHPQSIELNLSLTTDISKAASTDNIQYALDYEKITLQIIEWVSQTKFQLIEKLADYIAEQLLQTFSIQTVQIRLKKFPPNLPVGYMGVEIVRNKT